MLQKTGSVYRKDIIRDVTSLVNDDARGLEFDDTEMELISCAFKQKLEQIRNSIEQVKILHNKSKFTKERKDILEKYRHSLVEDLVLNGMTFINITYDNILSKTRGYVNLMFFIKISADIFRYLSEHSESSKNYFYLECINGHLMNKPLA